MPSKEMEKCVIAFSSFRPPRLTYFNVFPWISIGASSAKVLPALSSRRKRVIKFLRADSHSVDEVADYVVRELGYTEVSPSDETYQTEYSNLRVAFLLQYCPELLGDLTEPQRPQQWDEKSAMEFMKQVEQRTEAARAVPKTEFDIDFHLYRKTGRDFEMSISIEKIYESFSGSASGSTRVMRRYGADFRKVYRYYGVSQEDIRQHTKRFEEVVRQLTVR